MQARVDRSGRALALMLAERLATRLCHDLSGPLGGLVAALGEAGDDADALALAQDAATALRQRLTLLRAAWGAPSALGSPALRDLAAGLPNAHRLQIDLNGPIVGATLPPAVARLLLNALLLAAESLPGGGVVALHGDPADALVLRIEGARAAWPEGFGTMLADADAAWQAIGEDQGLRPARLQGVITALLVHDAGAHARLLLAATPEAAPPLLFELSAQPA